MKLGDVYLVSLKPTEGREIMGKGRNEARPCVIVSPDVLNDRLGTVMVAPMTSKRKNFPWRTAVEFQGKKGEVVTEQVRTYDRSSRRFVKKLGALASAEIQECLSQLRQIFS
jgi:mRNA interferase MazF